MAQLKMTSNKVAQHDEMRHDIERMRTFLTQTRKMMIFQVENGTAEPAYG